MNTLAIIFICVAAGVILLFSIIRLSLYLTKRKLAVRIREKFHESDIVLMSLNANFFGRKSQGVSPVRVNGALVLTAKELWFSLAVPRKNISIPLKDIQYVRTEKSFLYKTVLHPLLVVRYKTKEFYDEAGWWVPDADRWVKEIEKRRTE